MFLVALVFLMLGFPIAFTFAGIAVIFGVIVEGFDLFAFMPYRIMSVMQNTLLMAIPLFIFMGIVLEKTKLAEQLLEAVGELFGKLRGGVAISTILVGSMLAASTGVVGASIIAMGVISLPIMLKHHYDKRFATGVICASGTLGQIVPPSIVLIILADTVGVSIGDLFESAVLPSVVLITLYILYIVLISYIKPQTAPAFDLKVYKNNGVKYLKIFRAIIPPLFLIIIVLGSIFSGIATATESAAIGSAGAIMLSIIYKKFNLTLVKEASTETIKYTAMIFAILIGATAFSLVFTYTGGDALIEELILDMPQAKLMFIILSMLLILVLGFFIDFVEISFIVVPILYPIAHKMGIDMEWFAILIAMNLQTSFLTPPFGFSLFYLKGVVPKHITTIDIYKGVIPFIIIQIVVLVSLIFIPEFYGFSTSLLR